MPACDDFTGDLSGIGMTYFEHKMEICQGVPCFNMIMASNMLLRVRS